MTAFVLDCSIAAAWLFEDETDLKTDGLLARLKDAGAYVPGLWHLEVGNVLIQAERRRRITARHVAACLRLLGDLPIVTDGEAGAGAVREILLLARTHALTTCDAAYLELASRRGVPLATRDKALRRAAKAAEVETLP